MPLGIIVLMILQIISGIQLLLSCWFYFALYSWANSPDGIAELTRSGSHLIVQFASSVFLLIAIGFFFLGISAFWLARGYIYGYDWARHTGRKIAVIAIVIAVLGFIFMPKSLDTVSPLIPPLRARFLPETFHLASPFWTVVFNLAVIIYLEIPSVSVYFRPKM